MKFRPWGRISFIGKALCLVVENYNAAAVTTWRLCRHHPKAASFQRVKYVCEVFILYNPTIHPSLIQPTKCRFQTPITSIPYVEHAEPYHFLHPPSDPPPLPGMPLRRDAYPLPLDNIFSVSVRPPVIPARWLYYIPLMPCCHCSVWPVLASVPPFDI